VVGQQPEHGRAKAAHAERKAEEQARDHARLARDQLLGEHDDGRERRRQDKADHDRQGRRPEQVHVRQQERERSDAEDRKPDHRLAADAVPERSAHERAERGSEQENEEVQLRALHREAELLDQVEGVEAAEARHIEVLGEDQHEQHGDGQRHAVSRKHGAGPAAGRAPRDGHVVARVPAADLHQQHDADERCRAEPGEAFLPERHDHRCRQQRAERAARVATHLEQRLRESVAATRCEPRDARRLRMEDRRSQAHQRRSGQHGRVARREREQQQPAQRRSHAERE
jgi:hypothetical protein